LGILSPAAVDSMMTAQGLEGAGAPAVETGSLLSVPVGGAAVPTASTYATLGSGWEGLPGAATTSGVPSSMSIELGLPEAWGGGLAATDAGASTATSIADILSTTGGEGAMTGFEWACAMTIVFFGVITGFMFFTETNLPFISPAIFGYHEIAHLLLGISHIFGFFMVRSIFSRTSDDV